MPDGRPERFLMNGGHPLAQGLVFAGLGELPNSTLFYDSMATLNRPPRHGTLTNMAVPATATSGWVWDNYLGRQAMKLDTTDDSILCGVVPNMASFTVAAWFKPNAELYLRKTICGFKADYSQAIDLNDGGTTVNIEAGNFGSSIGSWPLSAPLRNFWRHFCWVVPTTHASADVTSSMFLDGISLGNGTGRAYPTNGALRLGGLVTEHASFKGRGSLTDFVIYNRVLSAAEISQLADPSNYLLSGLILPPKRRLFAAGVAAPSYTATLAATCKRATAALTATVSVPTYTAALAAVAKRATANLTATVSVPAYTATLAATAKRVTATLTATVTVPAYTATLAMTAKRATASLSATVSVPTYTAALAATSKRATAALSATVSVPTYTAVLAATAKRATAALSATVSVPTYTAVLSATAKRPLANLSATISVPVYTTSLSAVCGRARAALSATVSVPSYTAALAATSKRATASLSATISGGTATGARRRRLISS